VAVVPRGPDEVTWKKDVRARLLYKKKKGARRGEGKKAAKKRVISADP